MLRADSQNLPHLTHPVEDIDAKDLSKASIRFDKTSEHGYGGSLSGTVVTKERKDLPVVHGEIDVFNSCLLSELFDEASDF